MDIERINENTVKFYISYLDIEERGFDREEIWYNRERSEELFWEMMDEIHQEEEFAIEGPLWIQVQALEKGIEVLVTRAQVSKDGHRYELPIPEDKHRINVAEKFDSIVQEHFNQAKYFEPSSVELEDGILQFILFFEDFEDVISLASRITLPEITNKLYYFENRYYLYLEFTDEEYNEEELDNLLSLMLEYGEESSLSIYRLEEYGKTIIKENALAVVNNHFTK